MPVGFADLVGEHFELTARHGQGRAQLVRSVGDEPALPLEGGFEPRKHAVKGTGEPFDLVVSALERDSSREIAGRLDRRGLRRDRGQRPQAAANHRDPYEQGERKREHARKPDAPQQRAERVLDRLVVCEQHERAELATISEDRNRQRANATLGAVEIPPANDLAGEESARLPDLEQVEPAGARQHPAADDANRRHLPVRERMLGEPAPSLTLEPASGVRPCGGTLLERRHRAS